MGMCPSPRKCFVHVSVRLDGCVRSTVRALRVLVVRGGSISTYDHANEDSILPSAWTWADIKRPLETQRYDLHDQQAGRDKTPKSRPGGRGPAKNGKDPDAKRLDPKQPPASRTIYAHRHAQPQPRHLPTH
jgi:hypothetical protein